jgi:hypothetical protein
MFSEIAQRWRGVHHWLEAEATVVSYDKVSDGGRDGPAYAKISFYYHDQTGAFHGGELIADSLTTLYSLKVSDKFIIQS